MSQVKVPLSQVRDYGRAAMQDLPGFMSLVFKLEPTWFHEIWLDELIKPENKKILFICPPDSAKTTVVGVIASLYFICQDSSIHMGYVGDTFTQAAKQSVAVRDMVNGDPIIKLAYPELQLDPAKGTAENEWFVKRPNLGDKDATFICTGVGGPLLGSRLNKLIIDDVMDEENSATQLQRDKVWNWITSTAFSRVVDGGQIIAIGTRWHEDDAYSRMEKDGFKVVHFPAISPADNLLWPERWSWEHILDKRKSLGARRFELMYQGKIVAQEGGIFQRKWWQHAKVLESPTDPVKVIVGNEAFPIKKLYLAMDTAFKQGVDNSYSVIAVWGEFQLGYILLDVWRNKVPFYRLENIAQAQGSYWSPDLVLIEDAASGQSLIDDLTFRTHLRILRRKVGNDKTSNAEAVTMFFEGKRVWLREGAPWLEDWELEHEVFPRGAHDDQVDTTSLFFNYVREVEQSQRRGKIKASSG
ncbi:MAG: hypothetical protein PHV74_00250 [Dehalococcoidia bacterium]|nr:hypothetical protein [Dehalococcoidia bacterium]